ncbi:MAG TPA: DUF1810 domain-containing protein [Beijerinckiaceae bacterium]|jgi:uncharacterized protein (DUF1810 family)
MSSADGDPYDLARFVAAQAPVIDTARAELRAGRKRSHWMWFVFPQARGLGHSPMAQRYGLGSLAEARAYLDHPVLGPRLRACVADLLPHRGASAHAIFGSPDDLKLHACLTLFAHVAEPGSVFAQALDAFFDGEPHRDALPAR